MNKKTSDETNWPKDSSSSIQMMKFPNSQKFELCRDPFSFYVPIMTRNPLGPPSEVQKPPPDVSPNPYPKFYIDLVRNIRMSGLTGRVSCLNDYKSCFNWVIGLTVAGVFMSFFYKQILWFYLLLWIWSSHLPGIIISISPPSIYCQMHNFQILHHGIMNVSDVDEKTHRPKWDL